jgi:hypothetical protein
MAMELSHNASVLTPAPIATAKRHSVVVEYPTDRLFSPLAMARGPIAIVPVQVASAHSPT